MPHLWEFDNRLNSSSYTAQRRCAAQHVTPKDLRRARRWEAIAFAQDLPVRSSFRSPAAGEELRAELDQQWRQINRTRWLDIGNCRVLMDG
jgi:hypothetical protein